MPLNTVSLSRLILLLLILPWNPTLNYGQTGLPMGKPAMRVYTDRDGLPQNSVKAITYDKQGYLWIATADGAAYYNGRIWQIVNMPNRTVSNDVCAMIVGRDGSIWFGSNGGGVIHYKDGNWKVYDQNSGLSNLLVWSLLETLDNDGSTSIWAGTYGGGLFRLKNGRWSVYTSQMQTIPDNGVVSLLETKENGHNVVWVGTLSGGIGRYSQGVWTRLDTSTGLPHNTINCLSATYDGSKTTIWAGTNAGLARYERGTWSVYNTKSGLPSNEVHSLLEVTTPNGEKVLWVGTFGGGIARLERGIWSTLSGSYGLADNFITSLQQDTSSHQIVWIGTNGNGIVRLKQDGWVTYDTGSGLPGNTISSILETVSKIWIGTQGGGLAYLENGQWKKFTGLASNDVTCLLETKAENGTPVFWIGTREKGLLKYERGRWTQLDEKAGLSHNEVRALAEVVWPNGRRELWVGTYDGLNRYSEGVWKRYDNTRTGDLLNDGVNCLAITRAADGTPVLWAGTYGGGLSRFVDGRWTNYDTSSGLVPNNVIFSLYQTRSVSGEEQLWVGTNGGGLSLISSTPNGYKARLFSDSTTPALPSNVIHSIHQDRQGRIYLSTNKGVARLAPNGEDYSIDTFTPEDGLPSNECRTGAGMVDSYGRIWIGTISGAAVFDPALEVIDHRAKPLLLENMLINGTLEPTRHQFTYYESNLEFWFSLLSFFRETETRYQVVLEGYDTKPSPWNSTPSKEYTNLPSGDYTFKIWGRDYAGNITGPFEHKFHIQTAPWLTWWAYTLYFIATLIVGYSGYRWRVHRLLVHASRLEMAVQERTAQIVKNLDEIECQRDELARFSEEIVAKNIKIIDSIQYAKRIQRAMLPSHDRIRQILGDYFIIFRPKDIVSGDFYWIHEVNGRIIVAVADCTGHGVPGAMMAMLGTSLLTQIVAERRITAPERVLEELNEQVRSAFRQDQLTDFQDGMAIAVCRIDPAHHTLEFAGARRPLLLFYNNRLEEIKGDLAFIGGKQKQHKTLFKRHKIALNGTACLYLASDGYCDQPAIGRPKYGSRHFKEFLQKIACEPMPVQYRMLLDELAVNQQDNVQRDDITVMGIRINF